jgi:hypothetical protein
VVQKMLVSKMCSACSIGFDPVSWSYNRTRDGIDFHAVSLREISTCILPCAPGATCDGPVKSLPPAAAKRQRTLELIKLKAL